MTTMSARIDLLSEQLLAITAAHARDTNEAYRLTHVALLRILHKDPNLDRFPEIVNALQVFGSTSELH